MLKFVIDGYKDPRVAIKRAAKEILREGHAHLMVDGFVRAGGYFN